MKRKVAFRILVNPAKKLDYFEVYFELVEQICVHKSWHHIWRAKLVQFLLMLKILHLLYMAQCSPTWNDATKRTQPWHVINSDFFHSLAALPMLNYLGSACATMALYLNWILFFDADFRLLVIFRQLIVANNWRVLFCRRTADKLDICAWLSKLYIRSANVFQSILYSFCMNFCS